MDGTIHCRWRRYLGDAAQSPEAWRAKQADSSKLKSPNVTQCGQMWPNVAKCPRQSWADPGRSPQQIQIWSNMHIYIIYVLLIVKQIQTAEVETLMHCSALVYYNSSPFEVVELWTSQQARSCQLRVEPACFLSSPCQLTGQVQLSSSLNVFAKLHFWWHHRRLPFLWNMPWDV